MYGPFGIPFWDPLPHHPEDKMSSCGGGRVSAQRRPTPTIQVPMYHLNCEVVPMQDVRSAQEDRSKPPP